MADTTRFRYRYVNSRCVWLYGVGEASEANDLYMKFADEIDSCCDHL